MPPCLLSALQAAVFSAKVETVRLDVMVTDGAAPGLGLTSKNFAVLDGGVPQTIEILASEQVPLTLVLAFDVSGSVAGERFRQLQAAGHTVVDDLKSSDSVGLLTFSSALSVATDLTKDAARVRTSAILPDSAADTALIDATYSAMTVSRSPTGRALVIVFSDGIDTASFLRPADVLTTARRSDAVVYAVSPGDSGPMPFLGDLCNLTGGRVLRGVSTQELGQTFLRVLDEFRHRYLISYTPRGVSRGGWHPVAVKVVGRRLKVTTRARYAAAQ